jgi:hypothetical protein
MAATQTSRRWLRRRPSVNLTGAPGGVAIKPGANVGVFVSRIVVENDVDDLADRNLRLDVVEKSNELMTMTLHVAADDRAIEDVEDGEQCRGTVSCVMVPSRPYFSGSPGWVRSRA